MKIKNIKNVKRLNQEGTLLDCEILIEGRDTYIPYTAKIGTEVYDYITSNNLDILAYEEPIVPTLTLEDIRNIKIQELNQKVNEQYQLYLSKYPLIEIESFKDKAKESALVIADNNVALIQTPYLSNLTGNTSIEARNTLAFAVNVKVQETAQLEAYAVSKRDEIKACTTIEELEAVEI